MTTTANRPVDPKPAGLPEHRAELWYLCTGTINSHEIADDTKQMALWIVQQLRLEARVEELTELLYKAKEENGKAAWALSRRQNESDDWRVNKKIKNKLSGDIGKCVGAYPNGFCGFDDPSGVLAVLRDGKVALEFASDWVTA